MHIDEFREYCLGKTATEETFPFDETTLVFKVMGKMYALTSLDSEEFRVNLKCDPEWAMELREQYEDVIPGFHMSKKHWNTIIMEDSVLEEDLILKMIDHSYDLVVKKLPKKVKDELAKLDEN